MVGFTRATKANARVRRPLQKIKPKRSRASPSGGQGLVNAPYKGFEVRVIYFRAP